MPIGLSLFTNPIVAATMEPSDAESTGPAVPEGVTNTGEDTIEAVGPVLGLVINVVLGVAIALAVVAVITVVAKLVLHRKHDLFSRLFRLLVPVALVLSFMAARIAVGISDESENWVWLVGFVFLIGLAGSVAWLAMRILNIVETQVLAKYGSDGVDDRRGRKVKTQMQLIKRILVAVIIVLAISAVLLTIPAVRALGAGILASAGLISVVAGLAVQSTLVNVFAGVQLAFTDAIRVGDVVIMDDTYGTIEDITLSYVVLKIWDGRRVIYPSSHFTTTSFENWTRVGTALSGTVEIETDWRVPLDAVRARLKALLESTPLWNGQDAAIQVTEALDGKMKMWIVVSANNAGDLWDLRCLAREDLVTYIQAEHPEAVYAVRLRNENGVAPALASVGAESADSERRATDASGADSAPNQAPETRPQPTVPGAETPAESKTDSVPLAKSGEDSSVFTGSIAAIERNREMAGPGDEAFEDRKRQQAESTGELDEIALDADDVAEDADGDDDERIAKKNADRTRDDS